MLNETARARDVLVIRGGILDGSLVRDDDIKRLATLPPVEVLRAQFAGAVAGPLTMVVGLFTAPLRDLVGVIDARIRQLEEQGETVPAEPEAPEPAAEATETEPQAEAEPEAEPEENRNQNQNRSRSASRIARGGGAKWQRRLIRTSSSSSSAG